MLSIETWRHALNNGDMPGAQLRSEEASDEAQSKHKPNVALRV